ncbi:glycosyltransferase family 4 protein [Desulfatitalea alkaliphila]|uniref:Glycosyltransferase family 4 protein n=1 Tax=Desulfatitalea alkaliphila TaxID=2929485 RepID=A0AA41R7R4_9BACT|nr:glycosyltransferase family 4 protein [Desulfatitalea alkaliphila]MCJ8503133.1 glycosyltransferase family 4 protein [Desulfatitalea alkaliphila]
MSPRPKVFICIATNEIGGPGKGLLQFLRCGGLEVCDTVIVGFSVNDIKSEFDLIIENVDVPFKLLKQRVIYDPLLLPQAYTIFKSNSLNILQSHGYKSHVICLFLKVLTGNPWVAFFHGWVSGGKKIKFYNYLEKYLLKFADKVVAVSEGMVNGLNTVWIGKEKINIIYNAVDPNEYSSYAPTIKIREQYRINNAAPLVAVVGRFSPEKGHRYFVEALPKILKVFPGLKTLFIGDGPLKKELQQQINQAGLKSKVIFTGYQSNVQDFFREIDLIVLPSLSEGMPNVALEAMLFQKPVVATRVGGVPEVVLDGETGILVDPKNSEQLAEAAIRLFKNRKTLHEFGMAGKCRVLKEFSSEERIKKIARLYNEVLRNNPKSR